MCTSEYMNKIMSLKNMSGNINLVYWIEGCFAS